MDLETKPPIAKQLRKRRFAPRSKSGCRTCRTRRIKCDEMPGWCHNCTSSRRQCEGYDIQRLPRTRLPNFGPAKSILLSHKAGKITFDERRCFSFFLHRTVPAIIGFFDWDLWQRSILQMSQADESVYHAVITVGSMHTELDACGMPLATEDLGNYWHRFAIEQCGRAYTRLSVRSAYQDPDLRHVILVCCLLFIYCELLREKNETACMHPRSGLWILHNAP